MGCGDNETPKISAPSDFKLTVLSYSSIDLKWKDNAFNEDGFLIERSEDNVHFTNVATVSADVTYFIDVDLKPGTKYYYRISCFNAAFTSQYLHGFIATRVKTSREKLVGVWKLNGTSQNGKYNVLGCEKDDTWEFLQTEQFIILDNALKCGVNENYSGPWFLDAARNEITISYNRRSLRFTIQELSESSFKIASTIDGSTYGFYLIR